MNPGIREWSKAERCEVLLMAILPVAGAAVLTGLLFAGHPALWLFAFGVSTACAYVSMFVGVMPLLWLFRRFDRRCWYDYAASGFLGTLLPWLAITLAFGGFERSIGAASAAPSSAIFFLVLPAAIAGVATVIFWLASVQGPRPRHGI